MSRDRTQRTQSRRRWRARSACTRIPRPRKQSRRCLRLLWSLQQWVYLCLPWEVQLFDLWATPLHHHHLHHCLHPWCSPSLITAVSADVFFLLSVNQYIKSWWMKIQLLISMTRLLLIYFYLSSIVRTVKSL